MTVHAIDPLTDPRWRAFVEEHPRASVFHSTGWLEALRHTYGCTPRVLTTTPPGGPLCNGLAICEVRAWGRTRLVSLPFSDHCEPLVDVPEDWSRILGYLASGIEAGAWRSVELRPRSGDLMTPDPAGWSPTRQYLFHGCDLTPSLDTIHARFHTSCIQRPIRRAEREGLRCESGSSPALLEAFYGLMRLTRRRHGLPPQPIAWFRNLSNALRGSLTVHVASMAGRPIASILTLSFRTRLVYKYGCSDPAYHRLGAMPFLFWQAIQQAKTQQHEELDLGRSDIGQHGLAAFKERLGARRSTLTYFNQPPLAPRIVSRWPERTARWMFEHLPNPALTLAGRVLYKHFA